MNIGNNIKLIRIKKGMKQQDLARLAYITPSMLSQIERGKKPLSPQTRYNIAKALNCSVYELIFVNCDIIDY